MWKVKKNDEPAIQCSLVKTPIIYVESTPRQKIGILMEEYKHQEWLAYLVGRISEKENIFVEDIVVPPHASASGASAEAEPFHVPDSCVGIIHSHHSMGAFHSGTDQSYVDGNFPVSVTVAKKSNELVYDAVSYQQTPCGKDTTLACTVKYVQPQPLFDKGDFLKGAKKNIDKSKKAKVPKLVPTNAPYIPMRYRQDMFQGYQEGDLVVDESGTVLTQKELEDIIKDVHEL